MVSALHEGEVRPDIERIWEWIARVPDPEMPFISVVDLGIVREVGWVAGALRVVVTPTYSGCPAKLPIEEAIRCALNDHGIDRVTIENRLAPPWTTEWISPAGKAKLAAAGIAPPLPVGESWQPLRFVPPAPPCPHCGSCATRMTSEFGGTLCKSMHVCDDCLNPFEHFKCL
ncbi:1,2-phenylacetyl-CoA epoxidase subunit PaaD [Burkholderia perseverans]|uniref:1,2-phenylacetyl-CoA epoxidase subunit PaaD n=1 Tax=Burkholderia perseverans TaxID=2615214 RepID=UPI001FEE4D66|nr:1,2-phenylacetyl-CoA epoxidase subunit PaaD [Burkholderia perseverans]